MNEEKPTSRKPWKVMSGTAIVGHFETPREASLHANHLAGEDPAAVITTRRKPWVLTPEEEAQQAQRHPNGAPMYSPDGMMLDDKGARSIFDDVDQ